MKASARRHRKNRPKARRNASRARGVARKPKTRPSVPAIRPAKPVAAIVYPRTLAQAVRYFSKRNVAHEFFIKLRWGNRVTCPHCGSTKHYLLANQGRWKCSEKHAGRQFSVKTGTVLEESRIRLDQWAVAAWLHLNAKKTISSYDLQRAIGISQKSAWFLLTRLDRAVQAGSIRRPPIEDRSDGEYRWWNAPVRKPEALLQVNNAGVAFRKLKDFMRQILAVPKKQIDRRLARKKAKKRKR
jgi:transposase-like protein